MTNLTKSLSALIFVLSGVPAFAQGSDEDFGQYGADLAFTGFDDGTMTAGTAFATRELSYGPLWAAQVDVAAGLAGDGDGTNAMAALDVQPFARFLDAGAAGPYLRGAIGDLSGLSAGVQAAWAAESGFGGEAYFGETWGDIVSDGYATDKGLSLYYTTFADARFGVFGQKETVNDSGRPDRDYYLYGLEAGMPVSADGRTMLNARLGQFRDDAENQTYGHVGIGITHMFGAAPRRPTFGLDRGLISGLAAD